MASLSVLLPCKIIKVCCRPACGVLRVAYHNSVQDLRYAARAIRRTPGLAAIAIFTLALGIGANTTIFSVVDAALLQPLPFPHSDRLVRIWSTRNGAPLGGPSPMDMRDFSAAAQGFQGTAVYDHWRKNVSGILGSNGPEEMVIGLVPGSYFDLLGVRPILGRVFTPAEGEYGKHYVAAISERFWRSRFGSDPNVLGGTLRINGETYSIVAVMPDVIPGWMDQVSAPIERLFGTALLGAQAVQTFNRFPKGLGAGGAF